MAQDPADQPEVPAGGFSDPGLDESELRARRALGLGRAETPKTRSWNGGDGARRQTAGGHHKSRFVQDGDVPVVVVSSRPGRAESSTSPTGNERTRVAEIEAAMRRERAAREQAERDLQAAQAQIRDLQTRLGHAELARDEAIAAERIAVEKLEAAMRMEGSANADDPVEDAEPPPARGRRARKVEAVETEALPAKTRRRRQVVVSDEVDEDEDLDEEEDEEEIVGNPSDKPVKWWLPPGVEDDEEDEDDDEV